MPNRPWTDRLHLIDQASQHVAWLEHPEAQQLLAHGYAIRFGTAHRVFGLQLTISRAAYLRQRRNPPPAQPPSHRVLRERVANRNLIFQHPAPQIGYRNSLRDRLR